MKDAPDYLNITLRAKWDAVAYALVSVMLLTVLSTLGQAASVADFGAKGDGVTDDTSAFQAALASGKRSIEIPSGNYLVGSITPLSIPAGTVLCGDGYSSCIIPVVGTATLFLPGDHTAIKGLRFDGKNVAMGKYNDTGLIFIKNARDTEISDVVFENTDRVCVKAQKAEEFVLRGSTFRDVGMALHVQSSQRVFFQDNRVINARLHGVEIWGLARSKIGGGWKWERRDCSDIIATGNYFYNAGGIPDGKHNGSPLWGTGVARALFSNNIVDGAEDVGIDLEWSQDSVISGNTVRNCKNAGISLFFSCERISITGNTVINDHNISDKDATAKWWVRSGVWLTYPNRKEFPDEQGHRDITITGNTITCADGLGRRAIWIGSESKNISIGGNTIDGGKIVGGGVNGVIPMQLQEYPNNAHLNDVPAQ